jgi:hypothetical protein
MDHFYIYAKPYVNNTLKNEFFVFSPQLSSLQTHDITVTGRGFLNIRNVYLLNSDFAMFDNITLFDPFSGVSNLSASNPGFYAIKVDSYYYDFNHLYLTLPQLPKASGYMDVIIENEAGYGLLSRDSQLPRLYPNDIQKPSVSGIFVKVIE